MAVEDDEQNTEKAMGLYTQYLERIEGLRVGWSIKRCYSGKHRLVLCHVV